MVNVEHLKYTLNRYDSYIESSQSKTNLLITINSLILTSFIALLGFFDKSKVSTLLLYLSIGIIILSITSLIITICSLVPYLKGGKNKSVIYFKSVSNQNRNNYIERIKQLEDKDWNIDLIHQIHHLAKSLDKKYNLIKNLCYLLIFQFIAIGLWIILFILKNYQ